MKNGRFTTWWALPLLTIVAARTVFYLCAPLLDNDSIVVFLGARELLAGDGLSKVNTLPVLLTAGLYWLFGENILLARLFQFLSGLGIMALLYYEGKKSSPLTGIISSIFFGFLPLAMLYGSITKSYSLMAFLIFAGALAFAKGVTAGSKSYSALAGLLLMGSFLCYTFAASALFPIMLLFGLAIFLKKLRHYLVPSLIAGAVFGACLAAVILWRWNEFGWSVVNDYSTDWRFDLASLVWVGRWVGLADVWALGLPLLVPGIVILLHKPKWLMQLGPLGLYGAIFCLVNLALWLFNPVNHFPRVLLPSLPFLALFIGNATDRLIQEKSNLPIFLAWGITACISVVFFYPRLRIGNEPFWLLSAQTGRGILLTVLALILIFALFAAALSSLRRYKFKSGTWVIIPMAAFGLFMGILFTYQAILAQSRVFQARVDLVDRAGVRNTLGGGDYTNLAYAGRDTVSWIMDLNEDELEQILGGGLIEVCRQRGISHVISPREDYEGLGEMLASFSMERGQRISDMAGVMAPLYDLQNADRIIDNDYGALYRIKSLAPAPFTQVQRDKLRAYHSPWEIRPPFTTLSFTNEQRNEVLVEAAQMDYDKELVSLYINGGIPTEMGRVKITTERQIFSLPWVNDLPGRWLLADIRAYDDAVYRQLAALIPEKDEQPSADMIKQ